jgi:starvation-inducible DNA-binding protein
MGNPYVNDQAARAEIAKALSKLQADTYTLYLKTHGFHWNVVGRDFYSLHKLFEEQYNELWENLDTLSERLRALGAKAPASNKEFAALTTIEEESGSPSAEDMIRQLLADNTKAARSAQAAADVADAHDDISTNDLATQRVTAHEKAAWMLESLLRK